MKKSLKGVSFALLNFFLAFLAFFGCVEPPKQSEQKQPESVVQALSNEAPDSLRFCATIARPKSTSRAVADPHQYWPQKKVLRVGFLSNAATGAPTAAQIKYAKDAISEWDTLTNLSFTYPASGPYDIRWSFYPNQSWSYVGTDCAGIPQNEPTGNIGWGWTSNSTGVYTDGAARHEVGHQMGAKHEQCNGKSGICWNKPVVYADLGGPPNNWDKATVDWNVFFVCDPNTHQQTTFDKVSIMEYPAPARWTCNNTAIPGGQFLSELDKTFWSGVYPKPNQPPPPLNVTITTAQRDNLRRIQNKAKLYSDSVVTYSKKIFGI